GGLITGAWDRAAHHRGGLRGNPRDQAVGAAPRELGQNGGDLLGRLAGAEDDLRETAPQVTGVIDRRKAQPPKRKPAQPVQRRFDAGFAGRPRLEQRANRGGIHYPPPRRCLPSRLTAERLARPRRLVAQTARRCATGYRRVDLLARTDERGRLGGAVFCDRSGTTSPRNSLSAASQSSICPPCWNPRCANRS